MNNLNTGPLNVSVDGKVGSKLMYGKYRLGIPVGGTLLSIAHYCPTCGIGNRVEVSKDKVLNYNCRNCGVSVLVINTIMQQINLNNYGKDASGKITSSDTLFEYAGISTNIGLTYLYKILAEDVKFVLQDEKIEDVEKCFLVNFKYFCRENTKKIFKTSIVRNDATYNKITKAMNSTIKKINKNYIHNFQYKTCLLRTTNHSVYKQTVTVGSVGIITTGLDKKFVFIGGRPVNVILPIELFDLVFLSKLQEVVSGIRKQKINKQPKYVLNSKEQICHMCGYIVTEADIKKDAKGIETCINCSSVLVES